MNFVWPKIYGRTWGRQAWWLAHPPAGSFVIVINLPPRPQEMSWLSNRLLCVCEAAMNNLSCGFERNRTSSLPQDGSSGSPN